MKLALKSAIIFLGTLNCMNVFAAGAIDKTHIEHITVINNSDISLIPAAEGLIGGCVGGSLPPLFDPVLPNSTRDIAITFIQYSPSCKFDVLPLPNIVTYPHGCHSVVANNTIIFTGKDIFSLQCKIS
jgi:hypothetical protein